MLIYWLMFAFPSAMALVEQSDDRHRQRFGFAWIFAMLGLILLIGLVVKNGIVLLDLAERYRAAGMSAGDAVRAAAATRLRPIMMTTLCTLFGLLPLALGIGAGAELQRPLALAVIGGLALSTLVTLYLLPAAYALVKPVSLDADHGRA